MPTLAPIVPADFPLLREFWRESFPDYPLNDALLRERIFDPPGVSPETLFGHRDGEGRLISLCALVAPETKIHRIESEPEIAPAEERVGGLRWFGVAPAWRGKGLGSTLLAEACARLKAMGSTMADYLSTPAYYIAPGVDVRRTDVLTWLIRRKFIHYRTNFNMTLDLTAYAPPSWNWILDKDAAGFSLRRGTPADAATLEAHCLREWNTIWRDETQLTLRHDPVSVFLAVRDRDGVEELAGFAAYEANQCLGAFGPTGVTPSLQGHGLGRRLLHATLADMKELGRTSAGIGWVGPVDFYHRAAGAVLGPVFWGMRRRLD